MAKPTGMFRKVAILIVAICLGIVAFDYAQHARTPDGELVDISQYVGGVSDRFMAQKQAMEMTSRRSELLAMKERDHLPAAPQGWKRRDWSDGDRALLFPPSDPLLSLPEDLRDRPQIKALKTLEETARLAGQKSEVYVYENRDNVIAIRLQIRREDTEGIQGMAKAVIESNLESLSEKEGFAVVRGVTYRHEIPAGESADSPSGYRVFSARLGDTITIGVRARASDEALYALLDSIDYDSLNMLLPQPLPRIGSAAPEIAFEDQKEIADARVKAEVAEQAAQARAASLRLQYWADKVNRLNGQDMPDGPGFFDPAAAVATAEAIAVAAAAAAAEAAAVARAAGVDPKDVVLPGLGAPIRPGQASEQRSASLFSSFWDVMKNGAGLAEGGFGSDTAGKEAGPVIFTCSTKGGFKRCIAGSD